MRDAVSKVLVASSEKVKSWDYFEEKAAKAKKSITALKNCARREQTKNL